MAGRDWERIGISGTKTDAAARKEARKDRDRIFYSAEFERLEGVTQVATASSATIRNRLTHSYRVEQIARSLASKFSDEPLVDEDVVMAAALAHDIGHPPFGHTGEEALQKAVTCDKHRTGLYSFEDRVRDVKYLKESNGQRDSSCHGGVCKLRDSFEGNAQSFRILTLLGTNHPISKNFGLNLTRRVLRASLKYPWRRGENGKKSKTKWGVYDCDIGTFNWVVDSGVVVSTPQSQNLECSIMDIADDIAYAVHDLEDFYKSNVIPFSEISIDSNSETFLKIMEYINGESTSENDSGGEFPSPLPRDKTKRLDDEFGEFLAWSKSEAGGLAVVIDDLWWLSEPAIQRFPVLAKLAAVLMILPTRRYQDGVDGRKELSEWRGRLISHLIEHVEIGEDGNVDFDEDIKPAVEFLKQLTWYFVIDDPDLAAIRLGQEELVMRCFETLYTQAAAAWLLEPDKDLSPWRSSASHRLRKRLPERLTDYVDLGRLQLDGVGTDQGSTPTPKDENTYFPREVVARAVVDYICSLTDEEMYSYSLQVGGSPSHSMPRALG